ncbi:L,D-transpeptidase [Aliihoeflea sp. PC F10.4]
MPMSKTIVRLMLAAALMPAVAHAQDRYGERPPLVVSPDLSAPWVMQLQRSPQGAPIRQRAVQQRVVPSARVAVAPAPVIRSRPTPVPAPVQSAAVAAPVPAMPQGTTAGIDPKFLPQQVSYSGPHAPGTIIIDTSAKFLYLVEAGGMARRYGVGVGREGFSWKGTETITRKAEWPDWRPPASMIERERKKGVILPVHMAGGPNNPMGARALYLGSTLYRIHGTNQPTTIGHAMSSGCIRMRNEDVTDLYERVKIGTKVVVS